jgi:hypothetical protein
LDRIHYQSARTVNSFSIKAHNGWIYIHNVENIDGMVGADSNEALTVVILAGMEDTNWGDKVVADVHNDKERRKWRKRSFGSHVSVLMAAPKPPNPFVLLSITCASFAAFYLVLKHRETSYPASNQPRHQDHPLTPPKRS